MHMETERTTRYRPFILTLIIVALDQWSKYWVVANIEIGTVFRSYLSDFLWIVHVRNSAIGFSIGAGLPLAVKKVLFVALPLILLIILTLFVLKSREISPLQRWIVCGILGGGLGNIIDRAFREEWVVDFISVKVWGLFGFERWPTFNIADASIVVCAILLLITMLFMNNKSREVKDE